LNAWGQGGSTTVYTVNELYSWIMDTFDELTQMDDPVAMKALTPTAYQFINKWFLDDESAKYLSGGAIETVGYSGNIQVLQLQETGYTDCVFSDIGKQVNDDGVDIGPLLAYNNAKRKWWIRSTTTVAAGSTMSITAGTGAGTAESDSVSGEDLYANVYTLGTIADDPYAQIYIFQAGERIEEWSYLSNWDRGHIDVLIKVKEAGTEIDDVVITVFSRHYGDYYDHYEIDLSAGGRNAVPIATSTDIDNPTGHHYLFFDAKTADFTAKLIVTGQTSGATAEIISVTNWTETANTGYLTLGDIKGTFQDNEIITDTGGGSATVNGTVGDTFLKYTAETAAFTVGQVLTGATSGAKRTIRGLQDDGTTGKLCLEANVDYETDSAYYLDYQDGETITDALGGSATADGDSTTIVSGYWHIGIWFMNGELEVADNTSFTVGLTLTGGTSGHTGIILEKDANGTTLRLANITGCFQAGETVTDTAVGSSTVTKTLIPKATIDKAFEAAAPYPYNVVVECRGLRLTKVYEYFKYVCREASTFNLYKLDAQTIDQAWSYNANTAVYTDETADINNDTANDVVLPPIQTTTSGDAIYIGRDSQFWKIEIDVGTAGVYADITLAWEYWNGTAWTALPDLSDGTAGFTVSGKNDVTFSVPTDWAQNAVNGVTKYWIRCVATLGAAPSITTAPLGTQAWLWAGPTVLDGEEYKIAFEGYLEKKASPLGTFAGGVLFGARGVWVENMHTDDVRNYTLIDADGNKRDPPNKQPCTVTSVVAGDRVSVFRIEAGEIKKDMYTSHATNNVVGNNTFEVQETLPVDTPAGEDITKGVIRIVDVSEGTEHRFRYRSWSGSIFTLKPEITGTTDGAGTSTRLIDSTTDFTTIDVKVGDCLRNVTDGSWAHVVTVANGYLDTTPLQGGTDNTWDLGDTYSIHTLPVTYTGSDTAYVPFLDEEATATEVSITVIYTTDRDVMARVRKKGIIPFETIGVYGPTGYVVAAIRTTDTIVT